MTSTIRDQFRKLGLEPEKILELKPEMQVTPPPLPAQALDEPLPACIKPAHPSDEPLPACIKPAQPADEPLPAGIKPAHPTVIACYLRGPYLRQLLGITEVARLPFELKEPQYDCSSLQAVSRELNITCALIDMLYEKLDTLKPVASQIPHKGDWNLCQQCINAEREIRNRLLLVEAGLGNQQRTAA